MKDPKRIPIIMYDVMHAWETYPNLRLGQLISNAMDGCGVDLYYIEDDELIERIKNYVSKGAKNGKDS